MNTSAPRFAIVAALVASLMACGGGSDSPPPLTLTMVMPAAQDEIYTVGVPVSLAAQVSLGEQPVPDGTTVSWQAARAVFSPTASPTLKGQAQTRMTTTSPGVVSLTASASVGLRSVAASQSLTFRPPPEPMAVLVPAYFYPLAEGSPWDDLIDGVKSHPEVRVEAIFNPDDGALTSVDPYEVEALGRFVAAGGRALGYVATGYGNRSLDALKLNVDRYLQLYGRGLISGFFLDEMADGSTSLPLYQALAAYIRSIDPTLRVVGNPGLLPEAGYANVADTLVVYEGPLSTYAGFDPRASAPWVYERTNSGLAMLVHDSVGCATMQRALQSAATARNNTGWVYVTDLQYDPVTDTGNPWARLPIYWGSLLDTVAALNRGAPLPGC